MKRKILFVVLAIITALFLWLMKPSNDYLRRALRYQLPGIKDYEHFENRVVKASNPQPWNFTNDYNAAAIPDSLIPDFDKYKTVAYLVVKDGKIFFEKYWEDYGPASLSNSFSAAKSIVSLLVGCALDEGKLKSVDQPMGEYLPWLAEFEGRKLTLKDLLAMSAGIDWAEEYASATSVTTKAYYGRNLPELMQQVKMVAKPGETYYYQSGVTQLLALVLTQATGKTLSDYASEKLWTPMGAEHDALWMLDKKNGMEKAYCCFNSNARDFARFGQLILNKGRWNDSVVVSEKYMTDATAAASWLKDGKTGKPVDFYGYQFWRLNFRGDDVLYMRGIYGQYVFAVPAKNMVVVRLGHLRSDERTEDNLPTDILTWLETAWSMVK